ncbi:MAG: hypothetical protein ABR587_16470, partial [Candidatus Binatia bacterium]
MIAVQDSHRQKNWASEQQEATSKDVSSRQMERVSQDQQNATSPSPVQPANRKEERTDRESANPFLSDSLLERGRILQQDAQALTSSVRGSVNLFHRYVSEQVEQRPYITVGLAAGLGYVLGGGLANRITGTALGTA